MNNADSLTRLRAADPVAGREPVADRVLARARVEAIQASTDPHPLAPIEAPAPRFRHPARHPKFRRAAAISIAALAVPGAAALAATALFGPADVERGLPDGAQVLNGTHPKCTAVEAGSVYDCTLRTPPPPDAATRVGGGGRSWLNTVSLTADRDERVNGGCVAQSADGMRWRCYIGRAAADQWILDARLLGMPLHDECVDPVGARPGEGPTSDQSPHAILYCAMRGTFGAPTVIRNPPRRPFAGPPRP